MQKVQKRKMRLLVYLSAAAVAVAGLMVVLSQLGGGGLQDALAGVPQDGTRLGRDDAPVTIQLYEDFQCPACGQFARETLPEVVERHVEPGDVKLISETLVFIGPDSVPAARGLRCRSAGPLLAVRSPPLREPGRGEQRLRHRRVPDGPGQADGGTGR
jgi:protein-disulfide isomerase